MVPYFVLAISVIKMYIIIIKYKENLNAVGVVHRVS